MSLVAYNSSDESGGSDAEDDVQMNNVKNDKSVAPTDDNISDEEDYVPASTTGQAPATAGTVDIDDTVTSLLKGLPAPKVGGEDGVQEDELEEEVKPKSTQISDAPKPPKKAKMPVKISIPKLDNDSDEEEPVSKKAKTTDTKGKVGLFALLPAPVHVAKKESNRILIPHTLTKRPQKPSPKPPPAKPKPKVEQEADESGFSKRYTAFSGLTGYDSDSDDETTVKSNFFSLDSETVKQNSSEVIANPDIEEPVSNPKPLLSDSVVKVSPKQESSSRTVTVKAVDESVLPVVVSHIPQTETGSDSVSSDAVGQSVDQDAPLAFRPTVPQQNLLSAASMGTRYQYMHTAGTAPQEQQSYPAYSSYPQYLEPAGQYEGEDMAPQQEDFSQYMQDEQFLRLQGKKHRGKEEINIIDANMDDFVSSVDVAKNLTEESSYQSHKKDNNPTQQQRRKKQITYLAFQAKERELELKNSWAQSRMTKRQTQAKYGF
ncbi:proline-rich protein PRCC-like [Haliotis rufescens]|uniref:proline-rich protein PRCC-like n=1 Tax=Haliotis rufescens TaxID=6454 RepID=UPI00201F4B80|nr:proline-rich protein PRCC-like [Haliotis rufescens]